MDMTTEALRLGLAVAHARAEAASANIARADLPGARAQRADFGRALGILHTLAEAPGDVRESLDDATVAQALDVPVVASDVPSAAVSLDAEVADMEVAGAQFQTLTTLLSRRFAMLQLAMTGRA